MQQTYNIASVYYNLYNESTTNRNKPSGAVQNVEKETWLGRMFTSVAAIGGWTQACGHVVGASIGLQFKRTSSSV